MAQSYITVGIRWRWWVWPIIYIVRLALWLRIPVNIDALSAAVVHRGYDVTTGARQINER